jgi:hypothetical protein
MKMDSLYFFYNREYIEDSQPENQMSLIGNKGTIFIVDECASSLNAAALAACLATQGVTPDTRDNSTEAAKAADIAEMLEVMKEDGLAIIVIDSLSALEDRVEEFFGHPEQSKPLRTMVVGGGNYVALTGLRGLGKSMMRDAIVRHSLSMAYGEPTECWYGDDKYNNWKDFIQNPARPGRQIKKQKPPKHSFKAQMRSVNRNR